jgi:predicted aldo/keto reductase-like oxidoreductase
MEHVHSTRRQFLHTTVAAGVTIGLTGADEPKQTGMPTRPLGKTGQQVSILCLGGWHIGAVKDENEAIKIMHAAIDEGLTFFDNAWDYHDGKSEEIMGRALAAAGKRDKVFLMTKNCGRDAKTAKEHIDDSLRRLRTDRIDLMQFHEINYDNDPDWIFDRGAMAEVQKAQKEGKVRYIGFTGHKSPHIHLKMLAKYAWDTVQMPINVCDFHYRSFAREVVPEANKRGIAPIGMKSLGGGSDHRGRFVVEKVCSVEEAINYALSQPIASLVVGIDSMDVLKQDVKIARAFKPLDRTALDQLVNRTKNLATDGRHERFKSTQFFDGPYHRKQHGMTDAEVNR